MRDTATNSSIYRQLDVWRAFAAIWVVMVHSVDTVITDTRVIHDATALLRENYLYAFSMSGQLGVTMFFVISGYCIALAADNNVRKQKSFIDFLSARFRRIYPPYYSSIALALALSFSFVIIAHFGFIPAPNHKVEYLNTSFKYYFANLTLTQIPLNVKPIQGIYWSLCYEVAFYLVVTICIFVSRSMKYSLYGMLFIFTQISLFWLIISPDTCPFPFDRWYLFGLGALVYMLIQRPDDLRIKLFCCVTSVLVLLFAYFHEGHYSLNHPSSRMQAIFGMFFSAVLLLMYRFDIVLMKNGFVKVLSFLGTMSYSIYLTHAVIITIPRQLMIKMGFIGDKYWVAFLTQIIIGIGFGYIFHIFCERPFMSSHAKVREAGAKL